MKRREFLTLIGGAAAAWPCAVRAQQSAVPVIGFLTARSAEGSTHLVEAFRDGLRETGLVEGRNVAIDYRWEDQNDRLPSVVADLVRRPVTVIVVVGTTAALAAKAATTSIPIVFSIGGDPVGLGLVAGLNRPGGNLTGSANQNVAMGQKRLELLHEVIPGAKVIGHLVNATNPVLADTLSRELDAAAIALGQKVHLLRASSERDFDNAFASLVELQADALVIGADNFFNSRAAQLGMLTLRHRMPAIYQVRQFAAGGGLMSYGANPTEAFRVMGVYAGRILKGEKPADLPVQQTTKVELVINLKTASAFNIDVPRTIVARADEVIE
jgi:putative ABC transport system substrate-binding protein